MDELIKRGEEENGIQKMVQEEMGKIKKDLSCQPNQNWSS